MKSSSGFSLIEVMVTMAITVIGLVGLSAMQLEANRATSDSGNRSQAVWMLEDLTNRIKANRKSAVSSYDTGGSVVSCDSPPATICASYFDGASKVNAAGCSSETLALYDLWDVACSRPISIAGSDVIRTSSADFIANPQLEVSYNGAQEIVTITLTWDVRSSGTDSGGNTIYVSDNDLTENDISIRQATISSDFIP